MPPLFDKIEQRTTCSWHFFLTDTILFFVVIFIGIMYVGEVGKSRTESDIVSIMEY